MPQWDAMPDDWARKLHQDRREHGEVNAITLANSPEYNRGHDDITWRSRTRNPAKEMDELRARLAEPHESRRFADNFDRIFKTKKDRLKTESERC